MRPVGLRALSGVAAAATALGVAQLTAVVFGANADVRTAVGSSVIELTPGSVKEWAIQTLGTANKSVLTVSVLLAIALLAAVAGMVEEPRRPFGTAMIAAAAALGCAAVLSRTGSTVLDIVPTLLGAACGVVVLRFLAATRCAEADSPDPGRRASLLGLGFLAAGALSGVAGVVISRLTTSVSGEREAFTLPDVDVPAAPIPPTVQPNGVDLPSFVTSNADFYRIDTALTVPQLRRDDWQLRIHGMVDREITFGFSDLDEFEVVEDVITLTCVSNLVGGNLVSNAVWRGYRVSDLLARAGVHDDADMVLSMSVDGFTAGTPIEALTAGNALLAVGMNGEPLPVEHGYPARLVVPGLYGYVSATKWVVDLEVSRFDRAQAYWTRLGWAERGPIKTASRVDVPRAGQDVAVGPVVFGGVAWAQNRGVRAVEVSIDDGPWQTATLADGYSGQTWRMWSFDWDARDTGFHQIAVRATDNAGYTQTPERVDPIPDGATGWHTITFAVR
ncbi:molybdopterin-dependent oxidoreductase [Mycobacterium sp. SMC-4]|uniref:molybdopterin-dependent oxidoreductase n=1 Tax=Mycobacterium sp. SMC-4 TaxID=2857059 RepID=UPI0021B20883|nr:molybdopterin-dependent oxidoreductase [Mycobacterium sp. SMC-4]UXA19650.1 molybdopterin-dependent oxidoreductase [Mycobacterium sp. SMC-4]